MTQANIGHTYTALDQLVDEIRGLILEIETGLGFDINDAFPHGKIKSLIQDYVDRVTVGRQ